MNIFIKFCCGMIVSFFIISLVVIAKSNSNEPKEQKNSAVLGADLQKNVYTYPYYRIIKTEAGYGYNVFQNGNLLIHQPFIPVKNYRAGFKTEEDAQKVASYILHRLENGLECKVTFQELDQLGVSR